VLLHGLRKCDEARGLEYTVVEICLASAVPSSRDHAVCRVICVAEVVGAS